VHIEYDEDRVDDNTDLPDVVCVITGKLTSLVLVSIKIEVRFGSIDDAVVFGLQSELDPSLIWI